MNNASLELGGTNWAEKDGNILGYSVGDTSGKYSPQEFTFARGSNLSATRIDRAGLIVKGRENLLLYSNDFSNAAWSTSPITLTSGQSGYDGSNDAWEAEVAVNGNYQSLIQATNTSGLITNSIYAKAGNSNFLGITDSGGSGGSNCIFDLTDGSISYQNGGDFIETSSESIGNGWYRLKVTHQGTSPNYALWFVADASNSTGGTAGDSVFIQDAQQESSLAASPYIESGATNGTAGVLENTPRLNYTTGVANPYLLLEPSRTNLIAYSEYFGSWNGFISTLTTNYGISPEGLKNATRYQASAGTRGVIYDSIPVVNGSTYTLSVYVKSLIGNQKVRLGADAGCVNPQGAETFDVGTEWIRVETTITSSAINWNVFIDNIESGILCTGTSLVADLLIYGFQVEQAIYPTSYIPTYSVSATRAQDVCNKADASGEINSTEGVLYAEVAALDNPTAQEIALSISEGQSGANRLLIRMKTDGKIGVVLRVANTTEASIDSAVLNQSVKHKIALKWKVNDIAFWIDGIEVGTDNSANVFAANILDEISFNQGNGTNPFYGKVNALQVYKEALTDAELATLTTI